MITLSVLLALVLLIQLFAWPFMVQRLSFQKLSPLRISKAVPGNAAGDVSDLSISTVRQYAAGISRAWGWQLTGHEKALYRIAVRVPETNTRRRWPDQCRPGRPRPAG